MSTVGGSNWSSLKMAWMHTVCVGLDLAEAKVCVWLNAPLDRTGDPFIFACSSAHITPNPCITELVASSHYSVKQRWLSINTLKRVSIT